MFNNLDKTPTQELISSLKLEKDPIKAGRALSTVPDTEIKFNDGGWT